MAGDREPGPLFASTAIREVLASWIVVLLLALALGLFLLAFRADGPRDHPVEAVMQPWDEPADPPAGDPEPGNGVLCRDPTCAVSQGADPTAQTGSNAASHRSFGR